MSNRFFNSRILTLLDKGFVYIRAELDESRSQFAQWWFVLLVLCKRATKNSQLPNQIKKEKALFTFGGIGCPLSLLSSDFSSQFLPLWHQNQHI